MPFGLKPLKLSKDEVNRRIDEVLARYDLQDFKTHPSHLLSGGQKQLLAISGVLVMEPCYIVFDEPTTLLDLRNRNRVQRAIAETGSDGDYGVTRSGSDCRLRPGAGV